MAEVLWLHDAMVDRSPDRIRGELAMTLHQFTQPIVTIDGLGEAIVLPPLVDFDGTMVLWGEWTEFDVRLPPAVGDEAEVVKWCRHCKGTGLTRPFPGTTQQAHQLCGGTGWRRVAFVRVVKVLPIVSSVCLDPTNAPVRRAHVHSTGGLVRYCEQDLDLVWGRPVELDLPTAEPGGLVVVVERIDCPTCGGSGSVSIGPRVGEGDYWFCPTCSTPPEVTT
jgi:hypothetical protein